MAWLDREVKKRLFWMLNLPKSVPLIWNLSWDNRIAWSRKLLFLGGALAYFLLPTDILPDWIPVLGQLDDLSVMFLLMERFIAGTPEHIVRQYIEN
ncbi:MAG TPA: YkvA family protein [Desulfobacteria bacterium]|nr:YkvA family protein [Desulfobacteria bacterium]